MRYSDDSNIYTQKHQIYKYYQITHINKEEIIIKIIQEKASKPVEKEKRSWQLRCEVEVRMNNKRNGRVFGWVVAAIRRW